jgi:hypothetical protein
MFKATQNLKCISGNQAGFSALPADFDRAKSAYTTRNIDLGRAAGMLTGEHQPQHGDLLLAEVVRIGQHTRLELACGRRARMHIGDRVLVCSKRACRSISANVTWWRPAVSRQKWIPGTG